MDRYSFDKAEAPMNFRELLRNDYRSFEEKKRIQEEEQYSEFDDFELDTDYEWDDFDDDDD